MSIVSAADNVVLFMMCPVSALAAPAFDSLGLRGKMCVGGGGVSLKFILSPEWM